MSGIFSTIIKALIQDIFHNYLPLVDPSDSSLPYCCLLVQINCELWLYCEPEAGYMSSCVVTMDNIKYPWNKADQWLTGKLQEQVPFSCFGK